MPASLPSVDKLYLHQPGIGYVEADQVLIRSIAGISRNIASGEVLVGGDTVAVDIGDNLQLIARYNATTPTDYVWLCLGTISGTQTIDFRASVLTGDTSVWYAEGDAYVVTTASSDHTVSYNFDSSSNGTLIMKVRLENGEVWECGALVSGAGARITLTAERLG